METIYNWRENTGITTRVFPEMHDAEQNPTRREWKLQKKEVRKKIVSIMLTESEYEQVREQSRQTHISVSSLCRQLILDRIPEIVYREPAEMAMLEKISGKMDEILKVDSEMLRQLRLMGEWTEESRRNIESQEKELCLLRKELEGKDPHGDH